MDSERDLSTRRNGGGGDPWDWVGAAPVGMQLSLLERLQMRGLLLPPGEELSEVGLSCRLWEIISELGKLRTFLLHTDHLSDRDLYVRLREEELPEPLDLNGFLFGGWMLLDMLGAWGDDDCQLFLRYYADDEERAAWGDIFPEENMPPRERPPYERDRWLPRAP